MTGHPTLPDPATFDELTFWSSRFGALLLDQAPLRPAARGLDVACGTAGHMRAFPALYVEAIRLS